MSSRTILTVSTCINNPSISHPLIMSTWARLLTNLRVTSKKKNQPTRTHISSTRSNSLKGMEQLT